MNPLTVISVILGSYLIGSVNPAYFLGRILKKIDIREHGTKNAGTVNAFKVLGLGPALITVIFDIAKGLLMMFIAYLLGASPLIMHLAGAAVILGHIFPFYLKFKGGQGVATACGILLYYLVVFYIRGWLPWESLPLLVLCVLSFIYISRMGEIVGTVVLPSIAVLALVFSPFQIHLILLLSVIVYIVFINILNIRQRKLLSSPKKSGEKLNWRLYLRPLAALFILNYLKTDKKEALILIGGVVLFFLALDLVRLISKKINVFFFKDIKDLYKPKEYKKFSSITLFLFASFITVLVFDRAIAVLAVSYLIFGDFFSKFFGVHFGRTRIFNKSLEGSLAHLNACFISGYIFLHFVPLSIPAYLTGVFVASLSEVLPLGVNDNFSVPLLSASSMSVFFFF
jgi:glycerol-3-phosphate acyltransferase PlsY